MPAAKYKIERRCDICGKVFLAPTLDSKYCSKNCGNTGYRRKKAEERVAEVMKTLANSVDKDREFISVKEAIAIYHVGRNTIYRNIRNGRIRCINFGQRLMRIDRKELESCFPRRAYNEEDVKRLPTLYNLEPENCYTIGEVSKKFIIDESSVYLHIRKYSIPTRQIGNYVYVPKADIDELYKDVVR